jgi:hypothetical protein
MRGSHWLAFLMLVPLAAAAAEDDFKFIKLEQDVRKLEKQVYDLSREIDGLQQQLGRSGERTGAARRTAPTNPSAPWLAVDNWNRLRNGMAELEVIGALGPPTSMRSESAKRVLLYAMEIGVGGFLSGSVTLQDRSVIAVEKPTLK